MKKILFVSNTANFSKFNIPFIKWFKDQGWNVDYASSAEEGIQLVNNSYKISIDRKPFSKKNFQAINELKDLIEGNDYDIVHCHAAVAGVVTRLACKKIKKNKPNVIYTTHGFNFFKGAPFINNFLYKRIEKELGRFSDCIVAINEEDYQAAQSFRTCSNIYKIDGIGVNLEKFTPCTLEKKEELRAEYNFSNDDFIILYIAELIPRKNHELLLDALPKIKEKIPNIKLLLCGKGELLDSLEEKVLSNNLDSIVQFLGYRKDINNLCRISDLYVSTSVQEGLPVSIMEAMATGLPIIASRIRGHVDAIKDGRNGFLVSLKDTEDLVEAIIKINSDKDLRTSMKNANVEDVKRFSVDTAVNSMADIYKQFM